MNEILPDVDVVFKLSLVGSASTSPTFFHTYRKKVTELGASIDLISELEVGIIFTLPIPNEDATEELVRHIRADRLKHRGDGLFGIFFLRGVKTQNPTGGGDSVQWTVLLH